MGQGVERRLAAILAADVVGYSRLMAAGEAATHARLKQLRLDLVEPTIAGHRGRVVKLMGDGALVEFASVVDAVDCAVAIQTAMAAGNVGVADDQRIELRIGVNLGDVIIDDDDIYGDGVNLAARLEALAEPGGICLSATVADHVRGKVALELEDLGERRVKNMPDPVRVHRVHLHTKPLAASTSAGHPVAPPRTSRRSRSCRSTSCPPIPRTPSSPTGWRRTSSRRSPRSQGCG